jgi:uncharacterized protein
MSVETMRDTIRFLANRPGREETRILWSGGEPTLMPVSFFEAAIEECSKYPGKWSHAIQSNGTQLSDGMIDFLKKEKWDFGISYDGPGHLTDHARGAGTADKILSTVKRLEAAEVDFGFLCVLSAYNHLHIEEIADHFAVELRRTAKYSACLPIGRASEASDVALRPGEFATAFEYLIDRWLKSQDLMDFAPIHHHLANMTMAQPSMCHFLADCQEQFGAVDFNGSVHPCSRLFDQQFRMGHVLDGWERTRESPVRRRFKVLGESRRAKCSSHCRYSTICVGGCPSTILKETGFGMCEDNLRIWKALEKAMAGR